MVEGDLAVCLHDAELVAHIVSSAVKVESKQIVLLAETGESIGEVKLLSLGSFCKILLKVVEYLRRSDNSAEN